MDSLEGKRKEFFDNVWDHSQDPFQIKFDERRPLSKEEIAFVVEVVKATHSLKTEEELAKHLFATIRGNPERLALLLQLCGLTRNKIISDLKATVVSARRIKKFPASYIALASNRDAWLLAGPYLAIRARRVLGSIPQDNPVSAIEALNQATWPGYIRQERAKRSGHEGESRLAILLLNSSIPFVPIEKADNPLCRDATVKRVSFDVVIPDAKHPQVCIKATVHTSNIGQYGESKDHLEVDEAKRMLDREFTAKNRPTLLALVDGIGFASNSAGLNGVLSKCDEFCQFRTLWKGVIVAAAKTGIAVRIELQQSVIKSHRGFIQKYGFLRYVVRKEDGVSAKHRVKAGEGTILLDRLPSSK